MSTDQIDRVQRVRQLLRVTTRLSSAVTEREVADIVLTEGTAALDANTGAIWRVAGEHLELVDCRGYDDAMAAAVARLPLSPHVPVGDAVLRRQAIWIDSRDEYAARYPVSAARVGDRMPATPVAVACLPLLADDAVLGVIAFAGDHRASFVDDERPFIELLSQHCTQGWQRARLYEAERSARRSAEDARRVAEGGRERSGFLARAGALLSTSLDYETTLRSVAMLAVPHMADWCGIEMVGDDGHSEQVAVGHVDPAKIELARELRRRYPPDRRAATGVHQVMRTGAPELYPDIPDALLVAGARDAEHLRISRELGLRSAIIVPIRDRDRILGAISLIAAESGRRYDADDLDMALRLGERVGLAITSARLFAAERAAREQIAKLQRATAAFASARTLAEATDVTVDLAGSLIEATRVVVWQADVPAAQLRLVAARNLEGTTLERMRVVSFADPLPAAEAARTRRALFLGEGDLRRIGSSAEFLAGAVLPLQVHDALVGVLGIAFGVRHGFSDDERGFLRSLADQCAQALDRVGAYDEAVRAIAVRDDFLSIAGHELRTPLAAIQLQVDALLELEPVDDGRRVHERAGKLARQTSRLGRLIEELVDVSRLTQGRFGLALEDVDLTSLVRDSLTRIDDQLRRAGLHPHVATPGPLRGHWDRSRIDQVVTNLLSNALKYGRGERIDVLIEDRGHTAALSVRDYGIGIPAEAQQRIFERFERAVSSRHYGGLGLGLWISRQIVEAHGGTITVSSEPGAGAHFVVELPKAGPDITPANPLPATRA